MTERKRKVRIGRLDSVGGVISEMARVYRHMRREELDTLDGSRLVGVLTAMRHAMTDMNFEERIAALEADETNARNETAAVGRTTRLGGGGDADLGVGAPVGPSAERWRH